MLNKLKSFSKWRPNFKILLRDIAILIIVLIVLDFWQRRNLITDGQQVNLSEFSLYNVSGSRVVPEQMPQKAVLYFFAPWCSVCKLSVSSLNDLHKENAVQIFLIALDFEGEQDVQNFIRENNVNVPVLLGDNLLRDRFRISAYPTIYFLDSNHKIVASKVGYTPEWFLRFKLWLI